MRKHIATAIIAIIIAGPPTPSVAGGPSECTGNQGGAVIDCYADQGPSSVTNVSTARNGTQGTLLSGSIESGPRYMPYNRLSTGPGGEPCATTGYVAEGTTPPDERLLVDPNPRETNIPVTGSDLSILETYPPCPQQPRAPGQPAPAETRAMVAARYWERVTLPRPQPSIAPGRAITGKLAYLETRGEVARTYSSIDPTFGPLQITATGSYTVAWGDGNTTGPHRYEGQSWPSGHITHDYLDIGAYDIVVTERWTATWSLGGEQGVLRTLQTTGRIDDFPVQQIQAVIR